MHTCCVHVPIGRVKGRRRRLKASMHVLVQRCVKPWTSGLGAGLALTLNAGHIASREGQSTEQLCLATVFISHCWSELFQDFVATFLRTLGMDTVVWICSFALDQHGYVAVALGSLDTCPFAVAMRRCVRILAITLHWTHPLVALPPSLTQ